MVEAEAAARAVADIEEDGLNPRGGVSSRMGSDSD